jgi:hypothetical protein
MDVFRIASDRVRLGVTEVGGQLDRAIFQTDAGPVEPLHTAPWYDEARDEAVPPMLRVLRGDFFCAPFGDSDVLADESRPHGAPANDRWEVLEQADDRLVCRLLKDVSGAEVIKRVHLSAGEPMVYQEHQLRGGAGELPIGHHAMLRAVETLNLSVAPFQWGGTPPVVFERAPERGRSLLKYPQTFERLDALERADGARFDLSRYPTEQGHEDLAMVVSHDVQRLAWSAAVAEKAGWAWFALKDASVLRNTIFWLSNGGRYYPPFSRRHVGVLGIEETTSCFHLGHRASIERNAVNRCGYPTSVTLEPAKPLVVRYAFGLAVVPNGFERVMGITAEDQQVVLKGANGMTVTVPCDAGFVTGAGS